MTVKDLKFLLSNYSDDTEVRFNLLDFNPMDPNKLNFSGFRPEEIISYIEDSNWCMKKDSILNIDLSLDRK